VSEQRGDLIVQARGGAGPAGLHDRGVVVQEDELVGNAAETIQATDAALEEVRHCLMEAEHDRVGSGVRKRGDEAVGPPGAALAHGDHKRWLPPVAVADLAGR